MQKKLAPILACCTVLSVGTLAADSTAVEFSRHELGRLAAGKSVYKPLQLTNRDGLYGGTSWALIDAKSDVVWEAILDWEAYPQIFPKTIEARELARRGRSSLIRMEMGHKLLRLLCHVNVTQRIQNRAIEFQLVKNRPHDIVDTRGYWRLFPQADGRTLVAYAVVVEVPMGIVNLLGETTEAKLQWGLLHSPQNLKKWIERQPSTRYQQTASVDHSRHPK